MAFIVSLTLAACAASTQSAGTESPAAKSAAASPSQAPATAQADQSAESLIADACSVDALKELYQRYLDGGEYETAYLAAKRMTELAPEYDEGYLLCVTVLLKMSERNYSEINGLLAAAFAAVPDTGRLTEAFKDKEPALAIVWPFVPDTASPAEYNVDGNTCGNISAGGLVASQGEWVYFSNPNDEGRLYKIRRSDESGLQKLCDDSAGFINIVGDRIYYCAVSDGNAIYSVRTDGAERTKLNSDSCEFVSVRDGWIYYGSTEPALYRMRTDGSDRTKLLDLLTKYPYVCGDYVYYVSKVDNGTLWRLPAGGGAPQRLTDSVVYGYAAADDALFCLMEKSQNGLAIVRMNLDGGDKSEIYTIDGKISAFNLGDNTLYLSVRTDTDKILLVDLQTSAVLREWTVFSEQLFYVERQMYYGSFDDGSLHKVDLNNWVESKLG
jgi:hypothetical protein